MKLIWFIIICACLMMYAKGQNIVKKRLIPVKPFSESQYITNVKKSQYIYVPTAKTTQPPQKIEANFRTSDIITKSKKIKHKVGDIKIPKNAKVAIVNAKDLKNDTKLKQLEIQMRTEDKPKINKIKMKLTSGDGENLNEKKWDGNDKDDEYASAEMDNIEAELEKRVQASEVLEHPNLDQENDKYQADKAEVLELENEHLKNEYETLKKQFEDEQATIKIPETKVDEDNIDNYYDNMQEVTHKQVTTTLKPEPPLHSSESRTKEIANYIDTATTKKQNQDLSLMKALEKVKLTSSGDLEDSGEGVMRTHDNNEKDDDDDQLTFSIDGVNLIESGI